MTHFTHYLGPEKLKWSIWCELFMTREGYILYFKRGAQLQDSPQADLKADQSEREIHSDIQCLGPTGSLKAGNLQKATKTEDTTRPSEKRNYRLASPAHKSVTKMNTCSCSTIEGNRTIQNFINFIDCLTLHLGKPCLCAPGSEL